MTGLTAVSLPLDIRNAAFARRSNLVEPWQVEYDRDITPDDLILLHSVARTAPDPKAPLAKIKDAHHALARMIAEDKTDAEISAVYGYSPARIRTLRNDPGFAELIAHYQTIVTFRDADIDAQIKHVALAANQELMERLEEAPETFSNRDLLALRDASMDRAGYGPKRTVDVNVNDPTAIIAELRTALENEGRSRVIPRNAIEAEFHEVTNDQTSDSAGVGEG